MVSCLVWPNNVKAGSRRCWMSSLSSSPERLTFIPEAERERLRNLFWKSSGSTGRQPGRSRGGRKLGTRRKIGRGRRDGRRRSKN